MTANQNTCLAWRAHKCGIRHAGRIGGLGLALLLALLILPGCTSAIEVLQLATATPCAIATVTPQEHALAILAIDFDPPLDYNQVLSNGSVTLLVAIENQGLSLESNVRVTARLLDPADSSRSSDLLDETVTLKTLPAGTLRVVRFTPVSRLPLRNKYQLVVQLEPVAGEADTSDNFRSYDILTHSEN